MSKDFDDIENKKKADKIQKEVKWWAYCAWSFPPVVLATIFFVNLVGWTNLYDRLIVAGAVIFFSIAVIWWWWAIFKIRDIASLMSGTIDRFKSLKEELNKFRNDL